MSERVPLTIVGGYLGAGKTTLINALLAGGHGQRLAVIVNDFGAINIDASLIENADGETISLANGCICCRIADDLATTLIGLAEGASLIDHVVIETSGVAEPDKVATYASALKQFELSNIVVLADVETFRKRAKDKFVGALVQRQVKAADILVLTKGDQLDAAARQAREQEITDGLSSKIIRGEEARSTFDWFLSGGKTNTKKAAETHALEHDDHAHETPFQEQSFTSHVALSRETLEALFEARPASLHRAKGILFLIDDPTRRYVLQFAGDRLTVEPGKAWGSDRPQTQLVIIGPKADPDFEAWSKRIAAVLAR